MSFNSNVLVWMILNLVDTHLFSQLVQETFYASMSMMLTNGLNPLAQVGGGQHVTPGGLSDAPQVLVKQSRDPEKTQ